MPKLVKFLAFPLACLLLAGVVGCTLFPEKNPPSLANTTSAEQHERILWQTVQKRQWDKVGPLLAANLVWNISGRSLGRDQVIPYLQSLNLKEAVVREVSVKPNGVDMTVTYTLQLSSASGPASPEMTVMSVWQQVKGGGWILIAHSQEAESTASATIAAR